MIGPKTRVGQLPRVRIKDNPDLQRLLDAMIETMEVREGKRGDALDQALTFRDLLGTGAFKVRRPGSRPTFDDSIIPPGGPPVLYTPPAPENVIATELIGGVFLEWDNPHTQYANHSYAEIWRATTNDLGAALMVGQTGTMVYVDMIDNPGQEYCYWVRFVSEENVTGPYDSVAGSCVTPAYDPNYLLNLLDGQLSDDQFVAALRTRIDLVDGPDTDPNSVAGRVKASRDALKAEIDVINGELADIEGTPVFDDQVVYVIGNLVIYLGGLYRCILDTTVPSALPTNETHWVHVGQYESLGDAVSGLAVDMTDVTTRVEAAEGELTATTTKTNSLATKVMGTTEFEGLTLATVSSGVLFDERQARSTADSSEVTSREALSSKVTGLADPAAATLASLSAGLLFDERSARSTADSSQASRISGLEATVNNGTTGVTSRALQSSLDTAIATEQSARATSDNLLQASIDNNYSAIETKAETSVVTDLQGQVTDIKAEWSVKTDVNGHVAGIGLMNDGATSKFSVVADQFTIAPTAKDPVAGAPFYVLTQTKTIDGVTLQPGTYMRAAFIGDATISRAKIANLAVTNAKIANGTIKGAKIGHAEITTALIHDAAITTAKIGLAAITTAKIGHAAVDTLKIAGFAITDDVDASRSVTEFGTGPSANWATYMSLPVTVANNQTRLTLSVNIGTQNNSGFYAHGSGGMEFRIFRPENGGKVIASTKTNYYSPHVHIEGPDIRNAGQYTYVFQYKLRTDLGINKAFLACSQRKR